jgi:hypothetical protein
MVEVGMMFRDSREAGFSGVLGPNSALPRLGSGERVEERRGDLAGHHDQRHQPEEEHQGNDPVGTLFARELDELAEQLDAVSQSRHLLDPVKICPTRRPATRRRLAFPGRK